MSSESMWNFRCPHCQVAFSFPAGRAGSTGRCPVCGESLRLPTEPMEVSVAADVDVSEQLNGVFEPRGKSRLLGLLRYLLVGFLLVATVSLVGLVFFYGVLPMLGLDSETQRQELVAQKLSTLAAAMREYHDDYGSFPPPTVYDSAGKPLHSWRALLLPYLGTEARALGYRYDEPWDGPNNSLLQGEMFEPFLLPGESISRGLSHTGFMLVVGPGTVFPSSGVGGSLRQITDGQSSTILIVEVADSGCHWLEPGDLDYSLMPLGVNVDMRLGVSDPHASGAWVVMADGKTLFIDEREGGAFLDRCVTAGGGD